MFNFGNRNVIKQGGSNLISLPMQWIKDCGTDVEKVNVEMDSDKTLRIVPVTAGKLATGPTSKPSKELPV